MAQSFTVPTSVKIRLCQPKSSTIDLAQRLEACGASWVTLHARTVSARRRRQGAADLPMVKAIKEALRVPVISNGNVRLWDDIPANLELTGADGVMVGETLLGNPWCALPSVPVISYLKLPCSLFAKTVPDPVDIALEYLGLCRQFPGTASLAVMQTHVRHFVEFQCARRPWFHKFRAALGSTSSTEEMEKLLRTSVEQWRGRRPRGRDDDGTQSELDVSVANEEDSAATTEGFDKELRDHDAVDTTLLLG
ncbi:hypothetical protein DXG03_005953 [Asterophora parasitica]|uniref:DUS-like FMN-binding domain-containing protein n=1 Tax=Asterophora parasitica TaxID=117018 RepID=A0A9P7G5D0_9AGAR|nr:hypothetical protein DXG03_005953 [Asterophora parasitica]